MLLVRPDGRTYIRVAKGSSSVAVFWPGVLVNKGMTNPVRPLVLMLEKARKESDSIAKGFRRDDDFALANEENA